MKKWNFFSTERKREAGEKRGTRGETEVEGGGGNESIEREKR